MSDWLAAAPQLLLAVALLAAPGLLVAACLRFRWWDAVGLSVPLSLGVLAIANLASSHLKIRWGLPILILATVGVALVCLVICWLGARYRRRPEESSTSFDGVVWDRRQHLIAAGFTVAVALVGAFAVARGMHTPETLNQGHDAAFHVNSINAMAHQRSASPGIFGQLSDPADAGGFYPPTFSAVAALLVIYTHVSPIVAANVVALAIAILWPFTISTLIRRVARPSAFGYAVAMVGTATVTLFPALLLQWTVWPNALSILTIAPALMLVVRFLGLDRSPDGRGDPHGRLLWLSSLVALLITLPGMVYAQPGSAFMVCYLSVPLLVWALWRHLVDPDSGAVRQALAAGGSLVLVAGGVLAFIWLTYRVAAVAAVGRFQWPTVGHWQQPVGQVLFLDTRLTSGNVAFAVLVIAGLIHAQRVARGRFLIAGWIIVGVLSIWATSIQTSFTRFFTGYWYNDPSRIFAVLPVLALPLAAWGADGIRSWMQQGLQRRIDAGTLPWRTDRITLCVACGTIVCLGVVALQGGLGIRKSTDAVSVIYTYAPGLLVSPGEEAMYKRLAAKLPAGMTIAGDPYTGEVLAGVVSGRTVVYPTFQSGDRLRTLVAARFDQYQQDPAVCAAVKQLRIGIVVTGPMLQGVTPDEQTTFQGFDQMDSIAGLTRIDQGGGGAAYRVGNCRSLAEGKHA